MSTHRLSSPACLCRVPGAIPCFWLPEMQLEGLSRRRLQWDDRCTAILEEFAASRSNYEIARSDRRPDRQAFQHARRSAAIARRWACTMAARSATTGPRHCADGSPGRAISPANPERPRILSASAHVALDSLSAILWPLPRRPSPARGSAPWAHAAPRPATPPTAATRRAAPACWAPPTRSWPGCSA